MGISKGRLKQLQAMIKSGKSDDFYDWTEWLEIRKAVLRIDRRECQLCKQRNRFRPAVIVHHVQHLRDRPDLALSITDPDTGARQLISLCRSCHEEQHPERWRRPVFNKAPLLTEERWD